VLPLSLILAFAACGLPEGGDPQTVSESDVPYKLLEPDGPRDESGAALTPPLPERVPVVFWLRGDERLVPSAVEGASCIDGAEAVVRQVLDALTLSPTPEQWAAGLSSAIPSTAQLELMSTDDGVAEIELDPVTLGDPERLPLAVGQLVLSVTSAPGVHGVRLLTSGHIVDVPLPGGALAGRPVTADDYATLLPDRLLVSPNAVPTVSADIGCSSPAP
jgi:hypothetical protein